MRRLLAWIGPACGLALLLFCYRPALFSGGQFGYRDAAHYYYPLYHKVQSEWQAGRVPLWDPGENAGMPLLGNPTAAVLYPGKLIFAALPYPWAVRIYAVAHTALAFAGMLALIRGWGASRPAAAIAGIGYAFGAPVLFQYCNIIFLVGAAWTPWGFLAVDRWLRLGRPRALAGLAVVLAMQVLGGDPESAYVLGLCAGGYAVGLSRSGRPGSPRRRPWLRAAVVASGLVAWAATSICLAVMLPGFRAEPGEGPLGPFGRWLATGRLPGFRGSAFEGPVPGFFWVARLPLAVAALWAFAGLLLFLRRKERGSVAASLVPRLAGLAGAAALAGAISAAQLLPVAEYTRISARATDEGPHDIYPFSLEPYRAVELAWPGFFGRHFGKSVAWSGMVLPGITHRTWVPSLYLGGLTLVLALGAAGFRGGSPWRAWLTAIAAVSLIGAFGEFASPIWLARFVAPLVPIIGPHDPYNANSVRLDGWLRDGDGSPYCLLAALLPGFHTFRFPSKLLSFTALALAGLAGIGWDAVVAGRGRRVARLALVGSAASLALLVVGLAARPGLVARFEGQHAMTIFGPLDSAAAVADLLGSLGQGGAVLALGYGLVRLARVRPELAGVLAVVVAAVDLGLADASIVRTVPQADFEGTPKVLAKIAEAEKLDPAPGPYRVHRMPVWSPNAWREAASGDRTRDFVRWERDTIQPKYGLLDGVEYTQTLGVAELYDYEWFFSPFPRAAREEAARGLGVRPGDKVVVYPRRGFDLWNSRYFILPGLPRWDDADRGIASFLPGTERIYPPPGAYTRKGEEKAAREYLAAEDVQILRNRDAFPRAWVVHEARFKAPVVGLTRSERKETMEEILFANDPFWTDPDRTFYDARRIAWIETDDRASLAGFVSKTAPMAGDSVAVVEQAPGRVVLDARLARPGLVILADVFYPGWKLTVDDRPAPILRANRLMRGAAVAEGRHRLVYTYDPASFKIGAAVSVAGLLALATFAAWAWRRPALGTGRVG